MDEKIGMRNNNTRNAVYFKTPFSYVFVLP